MIRRTFPFYVGGPLDGQPVSVVAEGKRILHVPYLKASLDFLDLADELDVDVPFDYIEYRLDTLTMESGPEWLDVWIAEDTSQARASAAVWKALLDGVGATYAG